MAYQVRMAHLGMGPGGFEDLGGALYKKKKATSDHPNQIISGPQVPSFEGVSSQSNGPVYLDGPSGGAHWGYAQCAPDTQTNNPH